MTNLVEKLVGKQYRFESKNYPNHFIRHQNWKIFKHPHVSTQLYELDSSFDIIPGICGQGITLRSVNYPAYYVRHYRGECFIHAADGKQSFKEDASFIPCPGLADPRGVSFESVNFPGQFLRHYCDRVRKDINNNTPLFLDDATWYPRLIKTLVYEVPEQESIKADGVPEQESIKADSVPQQESIKADGVPERESIKASGISKDDIQQSSNQVNGTQADDEIKPLRITQQPTDKAKHCKQGVMLAVRASGGSGMLTYQWIKDEELFSEDSNPDCVGVNSDTLQFLSLAAEHSGTYACRVSDERANCIESNPAVLTVISKMKFHEFLNESTEHRDVLMIIRDSLIQKFHAFLQESGRTCVDDLNAIMEDIEAHTTVNHDDATMIDFTTQRVETDLKYLGAPKVFTNSKSEDREEQFTETVTYTVVSETSQTKLKGWLASGRLVGSYEGDQGGAGTAYRSQMIKTHLAVQGVERMEKFDKTIFVPRETRVRVFVEKRNETFTCNVSDLVVTFSGKKSSIQCKCRKKDKKQAKTKTFQLEDILGSGLCGEDSHSHHYGKELTIRLNGKCTWSETSVSVQSSDPEPLKKRK